MALPRGMVDLDFDKFPAENSEKEEQVFTVKLASWTMKHFLLIIISSTVNRLSGGIHTEWVLRLISSACGLRGLISFKVFRQICRKRKIELRIYRNNRQSEY